MKRIRPIGTLALCLALTCMSTSALAAPKAATTKPTVKVAAPNEKLRGGIGGEITVTPSVPGFLTLKLLSEDGAELNVICENQEVHTRANEIEFDAVDAQGNDLQAGTYQLSAQIVNQYGNESKVMTDKFSVSAPRPHLSDIVVTASKPFTPVVSYSAFFDDETDDDEIATIDFSIYRTQPNPSFIDEFDSFELPSPNTSKTNAINLSKACDLPTAAGYYIVRGAIREYNSGAVGEQVEAAFVVDEAGSIYMLDEAPNEVLDAVDEIVAAIESGTYDPEAAKTTAQSTASKTTASSSAASSSAASKSESNKTGSAQTSAKKSGSAKPAQASTTANGLTYTSGEYVVGEEGLEIGVGVSDCAEQTDAGFWTLASDATDEQIWQAITRPMMVVDVSEKESAYIYDSPEEGRNSIGTVSGITHGLNVIKEREDGWSLVEAFRNEDGAFIRGYIRTNRLRESEPNTSYGIVIDKSTQTLTVWNEGAPIGSCKVTTGLPTEKYLHRETPAGEYILATRRGTIEYYGDGFSKYTIRLSGNYHLCEIPSTQKNGSDFSKLEGELGTKATRGHICVAQEASSDGGINAEWIWEMTDTNRRVKVLVLDDKDRSMVPVGE